jgi:hypothetical protein
LLVVEEVEETPLKGQVMDTVVVAEDTVKRLLIPTHLLMSDGIRNLLHLTRWKKLMH